MASTQSSKATTTHLHTLNLYASVPSTRHHQLLQILTGVAGHIPNTITERHTIYRPTTAPVRKIAADEGGGRQVIIDQAKARRRAAEAERAAKEAAVGWMMRAVEGVALVDRREEHESGEDGTGGLEGTDVQAIDLRTWNWIYQGLPDPTVKTVTARPTTITSVPYTADTTATAYATSRDYRMVARYLVHGHQFVHGNVVLYLHRVLEVPPDTDNNEGPVKMTKETVEACKLVDGSGAWLLEAKVVLDGEGTADGLNELMTRGIRELVGFRESMRGCVDLRVVDRLSVDTRAK